MFVGVALIEFYIAGSRSLKDKRQVVKSVSRRIAHRFNVSVAEVGHHELWQRSVIAVSAVAARQKDVDALLHRVTSFAQSVALAEVVDSTYRYFNPEKD